MTLCCDTSAHGVDCLRIPPIWWMRNAVISSKARRHVNGMYIVLYCFASEAGRISLLLNWFAINIKFILTSNHRLNAGHIVINSHISLHLLLSRRALVSARSFVVFAVHRGFLISLLVKLDIRCWCKLGLCADLLAVLSRKTELSRCSRTVIRGGDGQHTL